MQVHQNVLWFVMLGAACGSSGPATLPDGSQQGIEALTIKAKQNPDLDLLLVIDDSPGMGDKQAAFARAFPQLLAQLASLPGGLPNLHIGVASTDLGTSGSGSATPGPAIGQPGNAGCSGFGKKGELQTQGAPVTDRFVVQARDGSHNFTGALPEVISTMTALGAGGCGFEQPLAAMRRALSASTNPGFLRDKANLAVVILSDEDDCSLISPTMLGPDSQALGALMSFRCFRFGVECAEDVSAAGAKSACHPRASSQYVEDTAPFRTALLDAKHGDARQLMLGAIVGDPTPVAVALQPRSGGTTLVPQLSHSCTYAAASGQAVADPAVRLASLIDGFPGRGSLQSVCTADLAPAAAAIGKTLKRLVGDPCLEHPIAVPAHCTVFDVKDGDPAHPRELPPCGGATTGDCYELVSDASCTDGPPLRLAVTRTAEVADDVWTTVRCSQ